MTFIYEQRNLVQAETGMTLIERIPHDGEAPEDLKRFATAITLSGTDNKGRPVRLNRIIEVDAETAAEAFRQLPEIVQREGAKAIEAESKKIVLPGNGRLKLSN